MSTNKVRKAIIPAAGFGTRLFPATKVFKKEFFPIVDRDGRTKPIILLIVEEAISAGIEEIGIIIQSSDRNLFEDFFKNPVQPEFYQKLSQESQEYCQYLQELGKKITFIIQDKQEGYGHAVFAAKDWINNEPFLLLLGDHIYTSDEKDSCTSQLMRIYQDYGKSAIALTIMSEEIIHKAGCVTGTWEKLNSILSITQFSEKPDLKYARSHLHLEGMPEDKFLAVFGIYILEPQIFNYLQEEIDNNLRYKGEFQLTTCLDKLCRNEGGIGYLVKGQYFDTGMPLFYRQTTIDFYN
ncbi:UTP--glucose-1-phosphate uridylyltransferase [Candidatus Gracilibacteria bacterium]|nr:UTP--glucose-1-phosphate uridylyltransferase [Candidatus Gracilibacteria bacterium]